MRSKQDTTGNIKNKIGGNSASLKPDTVSVGMWINPSKLYTNGAATAMFLSKRVPSGSAGYSIGYESGKVVFTICASGAKSLGYSCALTSGIPVHVVGSFGGTVQTIFINGIQVASTNYDWGTGFGTISEDANVVRLGAASGATPTNFFAGTLDDVRIFPGKLTTNDVKAIWEIGADSDHDGLSNWKEYQIGTHPNNSDTDGDGLTDGDEVLKWGCSPILASTDGSGMSDGEKIALGLNPNVTDTDQDGASDYDEVYNYFTNPLNPDSDNDGLSDGAEIQAHTYPTASDSDGDGLSDKEEVDLGTNPMLADTDSDGIDDRYEHSITNWSPLSSSNASQDDDHDGMSNLQEYQWDYSPTVSNGHDYYSKLIVVPPGINGIRARAAVGSSDRLLAIGNCSYPARLWVRPLRSGTNMAPQRLYHTQTPGFYINGVDASSISTPINIPASTTNNEYIITSSSAAWGTNIVFRLTGTNDILYTYCQANIYSPKMIKTSFFTGYQNCTNVNFGTTGSLYYCMANTNDLPPVFLEPYQSPDGIYGVPRFGYSDWCRIDVTGSGGSHYQTNTLNSY